jgi:hypothetical protein
MNVTKTQTREQMQWHSMDLHLHTPASIDYQQPEITIVDYYTALKRAVLRLLLC